jgi:hypothetical protein
LQGDWPRETYPSSPVHLPV